MRSLTAKLVIAFVVVTLVVVGILGFMVNRATMAEFGHYLQYADPNVERTKDTLAIYYERNGGWANVQVAVRAFSGGQGDRIVLTDSYGRVLADSRGILLGREIDQSSAELGVPITSGGRTVGLLFVLPDQGSARGPMGSMWGGMMDRMWTGLVNEIAGASEKRFLSAVNDSLMWAAITAGIIAVGLSLFLARQIVSPIRRLTFAAKRIASGDLSHRVEVSSGDEIGQLAATFNTMADNLARNEQLRRNLVADVAHELRTPLSVIQGKLEAMLDGVMETNQEQIASVYNETLLLKRLVADLRELSLAEAGQLELHRYPADVKELIQNAADRFVQTAGEKQVKLVAETADELPAISVDADRITQAISNLLSNAIRYSPPDRTVLVKAELARKGAIQTIRTDGHLPANGQSEGAEAIVVSVVDEGVGIPMEDLPRVFDRFYRVDRSRTRASGGSGLGLAIVKEIVEAHGGTVWAESEQGKGSVFGFGLPLDEATGT